LAQSAAVGVEVSRERRSVVVRLGDAALAARELLGGDLCGHAE